MATLNFPSDPTAQTPSNTFGPDSTPDSTSNDVTYIYDGTKWVANFGGASGGTSDLQAVTDEGNTTTNGATFGGGNIELAAGGSITANGTLQINNAAGEPQAYMVNDGSISIAWNLLSSGLCTYISGVSGKHFIGFNGSADSGTIQLDPSDGSIAAAGAVNTDVGLQAETQWGNAYVAASGSNGLTLNQKDGTPISSMGWDGSITAAGIVSINTSNVASGTQLGINKAGGGYGAYFYNDGSSTSLYLNKSDGMANILLEGKSGTVKLGGTQPSAPNITLSGDGSITAAGSIKSETSANTWTAMYNDGAIESYNAGSQKWFLSADGNITAAGGATFAGTVDCNTKSLTQNGVVLLNSGTLQVRNDAGNGSVEIYKDGNGAGNITISLNGDGSITAAGGGTFGDSVAFGGTLAGVDGGKEGVFVSKTGRIYATASNASLPIWEGFTLGDTTPTSKISANGEAFFKGSTLVGGTSANPKITLSSSGSATFAGNVTSNGTILTRAGGVTLDVGDRLEKVDAALTALKSAAAASSDFATLKSAIATALSNL